MKKLSRYKDYSVLNTDSYDKRRFDSIYNMSRGLQKLNKETDIVGSQPLLNDIWASLYKTQPQLKEDVETEVEVNKSLIGKIMDDESFEKHRISTKLDDLTSAVGTIMFGERTNQWIEEQKNENERMKELMEQIEQMQKEQQKNNKEDDGNSPKLEQAMSDLNTEMQQALEADAGGFKQAMEQAMTDTKNLRDDVKSLLGGSGTGLGDAEMKKVPLREQLDLADTLAKNPRLKEVADWAGRFKAIARKRQKSKHAEAMDRNGVTIGNDIERLLPSELSMYANPKTKKDFMRRFVEGETLMYQQKGKKELGKGPIILCLDQSGSMTNLDTQSKGFALALMSIAKRQRRDFCLISFSTRTEVYKYERGKITTKDMVRLATKFLGGGTNLQRPLIDALEVINESRFKKADIVFVTDGQSRLDDNFLDRFQIAKKEKDFSVLSLVIGERTSGVGQFSDEVITIQDFEDEAGFQAFKV